MSKRASIVQIIVFCLFIGGFFVVNLLMPDRGFSERENRYMTPLPKFSIEGLVSGKFTRSFEDYVMDQFALRDSWTTLKARTELALGKSDNRGVYLCSGGELIERFDAPDMELVDSNLEAINTLTENAGVPVYFALVPSAAEVWREKLPANAPSANQVELMAYAYGNTSATPVDIYRPLKEHASEYIYYRTDHHWTTLGAYYGYEALANALGFSPTQLESMNRKVVSSDFYGTEYSSSGFSWVEPDTIEIFINPREDVVVTNFPAPGQASVGAIYDEASLLKKDKYAMFMGGNTPHLQIKTGNPGEKLLILRDSFMDSLTPFLLDHYSELHILDLRYYLPSVSEYIAEHEIDTVLVCYSLSNFVSDANVFLAAR